MDKEFVKVNMEMISGQSMYPTPVFLGEYGLVNEKILSKHIAIMSSELMNGEIFINIFVKCDDEKLKMDIISEIVRQNPKLNIITEENTCGCNFGMNVIITLPKKESSKKELTQERNQLNRKISSLKKASLKN